MKKVQLTWKDPSSIQDDQRQWLSFDEVSQKGREQYEDEVETLGFLVDETKDYVVICSTHDGENFCDCSVIMTSLIVNKKYIK